MTNTKHFSTFDEATRSRDYHGKFKATGRTTIPMRVPEAYHRLIRSKLNELIANNGLLTIWDDMIKQSFPDDPMSKDIKFWKAKFNGKLSDGDIMRLYAFFQSEYWQEIIESREVWDFKKIFYGVHNEESV